MKSIISLLLATIPLLLVAQKSTGKIQYTGLYQFGMTVGKAYTTINVQMVQGIKYKNYEGGVGVALDQYGFRTVPVFAHLAYTLHPGKNSAYLYTDAGVSIPWNTGALPEKYSNSPDEWHKLYSGFYGEAGIGYCFALNKKNAIVISGGYSYKRFRYTENNILWNGIETVKQKDWYTFDYRRLAFRIGFSL